MTQKNKSQSDLRGGITVALATLLLASGMALSMGGSAVAAPTSTTSKATETAVEATGSTWCKYEVKADVLNVRSSPSTDGSVVYQLTQGDTVFASLDTSSGGNWRDLNYSDSRAQWAAEGYLDEMPGTCHHKS